MKGHLFFVLSLISIVSFGQSDLEISEYYFGAPGASLYKGEEISWMFKARNNGSSRASVLEYKIWFSKDDKIDEASDQLLKEGKISEDWLSLIGLEAGGEIKKSDLFSGRIRVPLDIEVDEDYFFILSIEHDINKDENNFENNIVKQKTQIGVRDKLQIFPVSFNSQTIPNLLCDYNDNELGERTPLLLVHGWQPLGKNAEGNTGIWNNFLRYYACDTQLQNKFKVYYVKYFSNIVSVDDLGYELRLDLDNTFTEFHDRKITIMAHSMGGLVSRSFIKRARNEGVFSGLKGGERVNKLITLGTPHHGSPAANGRIREDIDATGYAATFKDTDFNLKRILNSLDEALFQNFNLRGTAFPASEQFNRWDLRWDNYDNYYDYTNYPNSQNLWLQSEKMNGDKSNYFDDKIIAYAGGLFKERSYESIPKNIPEDLISIGYFNAEKFLKNFGFINDGIVPFLSAIFQGHKLQKVRVFRGYYHDEIAKGRFDILDEAGLDTLLFKSIRQDLLEKSLDSRVEVTLKDDFFPTTALDSISTKKITLSVLGDNNVSIDSIKLVGSQKNDFNYDTMNFPVQIESNKERNFNINFAPTSIGNKNVTLIIYNTSISNPELNINLNGIAVERGETDYQTNISKKLDFGDVYIYGATELVYSSVSNWSSASYIIDSLHITGSDADLFKIVQQPKFPKVFKPGDSEPLILSFDPDIVGEKNAIIEAYFKDSSILDSANLVGNGIKTYTDPDSSKLSFYEYWFNDDYADKKSIQLSNSNSSENLIFGVNTDHIEKGINTIHFRFKDDNNHWSSVVSNYVYIQKTSSIGENKISKYRYWFNDNFQNNIVKEIEAQVKILINEDLVISDLENNSVNHIHFQFKDSNGSWSSVITEEFLFETTLDNENFDIDKFNLYPNPSNSKVYLSTKINDGQLFVYDSLGKLIKKFSSLPTNVDVSYFKSGLYIFKIKSENKVYQEKIIKF